MKELPFLTWFNLKMTKLSAENQKYQEGIFSLTDMYGNFIDSLKLLYGMKVTFDI